jgi:nucleoid DNA-binding protein
MGINPKTKASIKIPASKTIKFKVGSKFKEMVVGK